VEDNDGMPVRCTHAGELLVVVIPAKAGIHLLPSSFCVSPHREIVTWIPAFAGMTTMCTSKATESRAKLPA
jgi:hypothetical protein